MPASSAAAASPSCHAPANAGPASDWTERWRNRVRTAARALSSERWRASVKSRGAVAFATRASRVSRNRRMGGFQRFQPSVEIARLECPKVCLDNHPYLGPFGRRDRAFGNRHRDRGHRGCDLGRLSDRRQIEMRGPRAAWCDDAVEAEPHRRRVTVEGECHDLSGQRLGFAVEQCLGNARRLVAASRNSPGCVAGLALDETAFGSSLNLLLQEIIRLGRIFLHQIYRSVLSHFLYVLFQTPSPNRSL